MFWPQVFQEYLDTTVQFLPYPDTSSMYTGLRNGDCDAAMSAVELTSSRVRARALAVAACRLTYRLLGRQRARLVARTRA